MVKIGIIGCSSRLLHVINWISEKKEIYIEGISDKIKGSYLEYEKKFGKIKKFQDYNDLTKREDISWIFIGSINSMHAKEIISALRENKNIFSEKPLCINLKECIKLKKEYDKHKHKRFVISYPLRHSPHYKKIKEIIDKGKIGKIISIEFNEILKFSHGASFISDWRRFSKNSGGFLLEKCCHDLNIANWFINSLPKKVSSLGGNNFFNPSNANLLKNLKMFQKEKDQGKNPFLIKKDILDNQVVLIEYNNGVRVSFHTNLSSGIPERRMYICGSKGTIRADLLKGTIEYAPVGPINKIKKIENKKIAEGHGGGDKFLVSNIIKNMEERIKNTRKEFDSAIISAATAILADRARKKNKVINLKKYWKKLGYIK